MIISIPFTALQVICDEAPGGAFGAVKKRRVLGVSTPAHPMILASALERGGSEEEYYTEGMPLVGEATFVTTCVRLLLQGPKLSFTAIPSLLTV